MNDRMWSGQAEDYPADAIEMFEEGLPVRMIATDRSAFVTCTADDEMESVVARNEVGYDYFPVVRHTTAKRDEIIGLVEAVPLADGSWPSGRVRDRMERLSERNLIGSDASLLEFVRGADQNGCRLVVSGAAISGLVTLSDLQRLPVRAALFAIITHLEMTMAKTIRHEFGGEKSWTEQLSAERRSKLLELIAKAKLGDAFVDPLLFTQFADKVTIIKKSVLFGAEKATFKSDMARIEALRNEVAHSNNYAATRDDAKFVCQTVRQMDRWIACLASRCAG